VALSEDQKAMLRLLAQRGQGYEDIAALMGISVEDVHARAREAVAQLEAEGIPAPQLPAEPQGAKVEPQGEPEPAREPERAPTPPPPPPAPKAQPRPAPPAPRAQPRPADAAAPAGGGSRPKISLPSFPSGRGPMVAVAAALAVIVVVAIVLIVSGGGGDNSSTTTNASSTSAEPAAEGGSTSAAGNKEVTKAVLEPVGGGNASGVAIFGRVKKSLALQVQVEGLEPAAAGQTYAIWLSQSPQKMLPLAEAPEEKGKIGAQFEVPTEVLAYLANETFDQISVTLVSRAKLRSSLAKATKAKKAPSYTGTEVLRGTVTGPIIGAALKEK
jgi:outer membrane biosynthesis protein TonB